MTRWRGAFLRLAVLASTAGPLVLAGACHPGGRAGDTGASRTLHLLYAADERSLYPGADDVPLRLIFSPLVSYRTQEAWFCREPEPGLALSWTHSPDWRTWTVRLREGLSWHDGAPVTAEDMKFTVKLWKHPAVDHWAGAPVDSVVVLDALTFRVHYRRPSRDVLNGWDVFYPAHLLRKRDPEGFWGWKFWEQPVGNGPFRYRERVPRTFMALEPDRSHPLAPAGLDRLVVKWGSGNTMTELESGGVDAVEGASPSAALRMRGSPRYRVHVVSHPGGVRLFWNHRVAPFHRASVRRALVMAVDRRELLRTLDLPDDLPITDGIHTPCQFSRRELSDARPFDPAGARELLSAAGWRDEDGDGIRERVGRELGFTTTVPDDWLQAREAAVYLQQALRRVGVAMEVESLESGVVGKRLRAGDFDGLIWIAGPWPEHHLERFGSGNPLGFDDPELAELLREARKAMEPAVQDSLYRAASEIFEREIPALWLYPKVDFHVTREGVEGYEAEYGDLMMNLWRVWMDGGG